MERIPDKTSPFIIPVFLPHQGCPHRCIFCNQTVVTGEKAELPTDQALQAHIDACLRYRSPSETDSQISFYGGNFLGLKLDAIERLLKVATAYVVEGEINSLRFSTRPDTIDAEKMALLADYPVKTIELGVQSMNDAVLSKSARGHSAADSGTAAARVRTSGFELGLQMMLGLPGDTPATALETAHQLVAMRPAFVRIYPTLVLSGSPLEGLYRKGRYQPLTLNEAVRQAKQLYRLFHQNQIAVIRMGLQSDPALSANDHIIAGPWHPAFGHLVRSACFYDNLVEKINRLYERKKIMLIRIHPHDVSYLTGMKKKNMLALKKQFHLEQIDLEQTEQVDPGEPQVGWKAAG